MPLQSRISVALTKSGHQFRIEIQSHLRKAPLLSVLIETEFSDLTLHARGKVRDLYSVGEFLLLVATDRISAFDHVLATGIPGKGKVLTQLPLFWFDFLKDVVPNHLISADVRQYPRE